MTWDEQENAVRQLGELIGYGRLIQIAQQLSASPPPPVDLSRGRCIHRVQLNQPCAECEQYQANAGSVR